MPFSYLLGVLSLSGSRLSGDQHGLILVVLQHVSVGLIGDGEQMRRHFGSALAHEHSRHRLCVDRKAFVGVDHDAEETGVRLKRAFHTLLLLSGSEPASATGL